MVKTDLATQTLLPMTIIKISQTILNISKIHNTVKCTQ